MAVDDYDVFENVEVVCNGNGFNSNCFLRPIIDLGSNGYWAYLVLKDLIGNNIENGKVDYYIYFISPTVGTLYSGVRLFESSYSADDYLVDFYLDAVYKYFHLYISGNSVRNWSISPSVWHHVVIDWWLEGGSYYIKVVVDDDDDNSYIQSISPSNLRWHLYFYQTADGVYFRVDNLKVYKRWS